MEFKAIRQPDLLGEILGQIQQNVRQGALKKGDRLPAEREWAATLGVSRTTLREAVKSLELLGLVECRQGDGNYIAGDLSHCLATPLSILFQLEGGTARQLHQFRSALEVAAVQSAGLVMTREEAHGLEDICCAMERVNSQEEAARLDRQFHMTVAEISANPLIITMMSAAETLIHSQISKARRRMLESEDALAAVNRQHRDIVAVLRSRDGGPAVEAMMRHMDFVGEFYIDQPSESPQEEETP